jgi:hypothetical protein
MAKPNLKQLLNDAKSPTAAKPSAKSATVHIEESGIQKRLVHKPGEVNISAYFPAEVKSALRLVQAKTGKNVKQCLAEALADYFRKYNVPVTVPLE